MDNLRDIDTAHGDMESSGTTPSEMPHLPVPALRWRRLLYAVVMIVVPIISFALASNNGPLAPNWQSGKPSDYTNILLGWTGSGIFYPFLACSMLCMLLLLVSPQHFSKIFLIRLGIYTGVVLALQYTILLSISVDDSVFYGAIAAGILLPLGVGWIYPKVAARFGIKTTWAVTLCLVSFLLLISFFARANMFLSIVPILLCVAILGSGPFWCLVLATLVSLRLLRDHDLAQKHHPGYILGIAAWLVAYIEAWPIAISRTLEFYASLPTSPPDCYVATAAARGHPRIVRSSPLVTNSGRIMWLNAQVGYFKCAELALMTVFPAGHRICRAIYDCVGSSLARMIVHPLLADIVYISLKPIEWGLKTMMRLLFPHIEDTAYRLYVDVE